MANPFDVANAMDETPQGVVLDGRYHCLGCSEDMDTRFARTHPLLCYLAATLMDIRLGELLDSEGTV